MDELNGRAKSSQLLHWSRVVKQSGNQLKGFYIGGLGEKRNEPGPMPNEAGSGRSCAAQRQQPATLLTGALYLHHTLTQPG